MQYLLTKKEIIDQFEISEFVLKTQQQIAKDFAGSGYEFDQEFISQESSFHELIINVSGMLAEVLKDGEQKMLQLLYQIDLPQKEFLTILNSDNFVQLLAEKIIRREAYKVFLRTKF